jgi:hypothetical protein
MWRMQSRRRNARLLGFAALFVTCCVAQPKEECRAPDVEKDGTATVRGVVTKNDRRCSVDGECDLVIRCGASEIRIAYAQAGDVPENSDAFRKARAAGGLGGPPVKIAEKVRAGEIVEAHGRASAAKGIVWRVGIYYLNSWIRVISSEGAEKISTPEIPRGPATGAAGELYSYSAGGASSSLGHPISYSIDWGDGGRSQILRGASGESHRWVAPGTYKLTVEAMCAQDESPSVSSPALTVTIKPR